MFVDGYDPAMLMEAHADYLADNAMYHDVNGDYMNPAAYGARLVFITRLFVCTVTAQLVDNEALTSR